MELTEEVKALLLNTAKELKGSTRRMFMARTVQALGEGGQRLAERELGWNRGTLRKGKHEVEIRALVPGPQAEALTIADLRQTRDEVAKTLQGSNVPLEHIRLKAFEQTLKDLGRDDPELAVRLTACYLEYRFTAIPLYPDVIPALSALRGKYRLGLVTNGNTYPERCGLPETFAFTVFAQDHGVQKPQPQFYEWALSEASALPHEIIHVGDSLRNDVYGAQAVGIRTIWVNRHQWRNETDIQPFAEITSLEELPKVLTQCAS
ncbi:HAD family hydrolase [Ktedonobacteria bacterium brp13]|nr:HAD family hydrolase [Ktedonobacteria bacterium brp13]